jgi:tyrosine-protein kinase Etk/Wzc
MKHINDQNSTNALIQQYLSKIFALRYYYIVCIVFFFAIAFFINKFSQRAYEVSATLGPVQEDRSSALASENMFRQTGQFSAGKKIEDAINNLSSFSLVSAVVNDLNLEIGYYKESTNFLKKPTDVSLNSPFLVNLDKSHIQPIDVKFNIIILNDSTFKLTASKKKVTLYNYIDNKIVSENEVVNVDTVCKFNKTISNKKMRFSVTYNKNFQPEKKGARDKYYFMLFHLEELSKAYLESLKVEPISVLASIIGLKFTGGNLDKSINFLNSYINSFLEQDLTKKNKISVNTIKFIDSQISEISDSLSKSESKLRNYKSSNQVMDLSFQGQRAYDEMSQLEADRTNLELQSRYYTYIINYAKTNPNMNGVVTPSSSKVNDPIMSQLITELNSQNAERSTIIATNNNEKNLFLVQIDNKIKNLKQTIVDNATSNLNTINITLSELDYKADKISKQIANMPKTEMNMVNIQRKYTMADANYTYLLQKRSEAAITFASNLPDYEILEPAREITSITVKPKKLTNYVLFIFISLLIPTSVLFIREFLNNRISGIYETENMIGKSVFGLIYTNLKKYEAVVEQSPRSAIAESFRNLRSSLLRKIKSDKPEVIAITSSQPQDGKSFISFNLSASIASVGYKTVVIDCDLRRPTLHDKFKEENNSGVSNYLIHNAKVQDLVRKTSVENLFFIPAGPLIPNPSELIDYGVLDDLIDELKKDFKFIIIDTPPVGLVADTVPLLKYAVQVLVVARNNHTPKDILGNALTTLEINKIDNFELVLNDLDLEKSPYSGYKNYYNRD